MARTALTAQEPTTSGIVVSMTAANVDGHEVVSGAVLVVTNGAGSGSINVTQITPGTVDSNVIADKVVAVGFGVTKHIKIGGAGYRKSNNKVDVDFSGVTSVTCAAITV